MENEHVSSSEISTDSSTNSECLLNFGEQGKELLEDEHKEKDKTHPGLVLDLRNIPAICGPDPEQSDSIEKLSAVLEQPEESSMIAESSRSPRLLDDKEANCILRKRIQSLDEIMTQLKEELRREINLWRREREEFQRIREKNDILALEEATAAARAAAAAYAAESPLSNNMGDLLDINSEETLRELTILEYEKKLARYQDEFSFSQAEQRYNIRWKLVANAYKQKLMEVERLCNEELVKVQQDASSLKPLNEMVSQWYSDEGNRGDSIQELGTEMKMQECKMMNESMMNNYSSYRKIDAEVNMTPEIFAAKFKTDDLLNQTRPFEKS